MEEFLLLPIKELMTMYFLMDTMTCWFKIPIHFMKVDAKKYNLFEDYGDNPNVGQAYYSGYYGGQQEDKVLDKINDPDVFLDWERHVENLFMVNNYSDIIEVKLVIAEFSSYAIYCGFNRDIANKLELYPYTTYGDTCHLATKIENQKKRIGFSKTNLPSSRNVVHKPQASTFKSWSKKDETPKVAFKDNSKPKVEEKGRLFTNPTRCFKCNDMGHITINCPTKRTLVFCEDLNGLIAKWILLKRKK
ncbi:hypothetical protein M9H77_02926 [Catharanthus roseus]|uniref:Uncharacterized protein n=1 Tax=Catharanthus roseus TaxID=4058 RepID=A0ACC0C9P2_CATRO|nr:hypothetical protein M9H77_02926 [Catharanthus roseus]